MNEQQDISGMRGLTRRKFLYTLLAGGAVGASTTTYFLSSKPTRAEVFIAKAQDYGRDISALLLQGFNELGIGRKEIYGKRILLKPNLVETVCQGSA